MALQWSIINEKDAPVAPARMSKGAAEANGIIGQLKQGSVAKVTPDDGQTLRGLRANLSRAAKGRGVKLQTWDVEGDLYVKQLG